MLIFDVKANSLEGPVATVLWTLLRTSCFTVGPFGVPGSLAVTVVAEPDAPSELTMILPSSDDEAAREEPCLAEPRADGCIKLCGEPACGMCTESVVATGPPRADANGAVSTELTEVVVKDTEGRTTGYTVWLEIIEVLVPPAHWLHSIMNVFVSIVVTNKAPVSFSPCL